MISHTLEQKWMDICKKGLEEFHKAQRNKNQVQLVQRNCNFLKQVDVTYDRVLGFNERGLHLKDPVYQKLEKECNWHTGPNYDYLKNALARLGNRTMNEEEYNIIASMEKEPSSGYNHIPKEVEKFRNKPTGFPFYCNRSPSSKEELNSQKGDSK